MPTFQLILMLPKLGKPALKTILRRSAEYILETGGTLRKMENLGCQATPYVVLRKHKEAHYFLMDYDLAKKDEPILMDMFRRDREVLRASCVTLVTSPELLLMEKEKKECTIWQDMLPPPYRPVVIKLQNTKTKKEKRAEKLKFKYDESGLNYSQI